MIEKKIYRCEYKDLGMRPYAKAVRAGDLIFVSGMAGVDAETGQLAVGKWEEKDATIKEQARVAITKIKNALEEAGSSLDNIVYALVLLIDRDDYYAVNNVMRDFGMKPEDIACSLVECGLYPRGSRVEIEVTAIAGDKKK